MGSISLRKVEKTYGGAGKGVKAIHGVDAEIADGEFIVIVGPSGCGKSTLLRMVAGLEEITGGDIAIGGRVVNQLEPAERDIAMVFQNYALYPHMSVYDNMAYGLKIKRVPKPEIDTRVHKAAKILELGELLERKPRQLSGGQRQRVAIGRAIVRQPKAFLFDEPLSNLDAALRVNMRVEIMQLHRDLGATMIYVTHDQVEAMTMADRIVVLNRGVIEQVGSPLELYNHPRSLFVAGFIGSPRMNFVTGAAAAKYNAHTIGIRPEHVSLGGGPWQGRIELVEHLGADSFLHIEAGAVGRLTVRAAGGFAGRPGDAVTLAPDPARIHKFDQNGKVTA